MKKMRFDLSDLPQELIAQLSWNQKRPDQHEPEGVVRFDAIHRSYQETGNMAETARRFMISRQRVHQILTRDRKPNPLRTPHPDRQET